MPKSLPLFALLLLGACRSSQPVETSTPPQLLDEAHRAELLDAVKSLEGRWELEGTPEPAYFEFGVTGAGTAVREVMFPGTPQEMTNMYSLDDNSIVMVHYCAHGNQPHMRAKALEDGRLAFESIGVRDTASADEVYMGDMTLVFVDEDHIEQIWSQRPRQEGDEPMTMKLSRVESR